MNSMSRADWKVRTLKSLRGYYASVISDFNEAEGGNDSHSGVSNAPRTSIDARKRAVYPAQWTQYRLGGTMQNYAWLGHISFHAAMGKDGEIFFKNLENSIEGLNTLENQLVDVTAQVKKEGLVGRAAKRRGEELMGGAAQFNLAQNADDFKSELRSINSDVRNMFTAELGTYKDLTTAQKALGTMILGTLNGPRAAFSQGNDLYSTILKTGVSMESAATIWGRLSNTSKNVFGSLANFMGQDIGQKDTYRQLVKEAFGIDPDVGISITQHWQELFSEMGFEDAFRAGDEAQFSSFKSQMNKFFKTQGLGGRDLDRALTMVNSMFTRGLSNVDADKAMYSSFNPLAAFSWIIEQLNESTMMVAAQRMDELAARAVKFLRDHQGDPTVFENGNLRDDFTFDDHKSELGYKTIGWGDLEIQLGAKAYDYYAHNILRRHVGTTLEQVALRALKQKKGERPFTIEEYRGIMSRVVADTAGEASGLTRATKKGTFQKFGMPLLGWSVHRGGQWATMFKDKDMQITLNSFLTGMLINSMALLPAVMAYSLWRDWYDDYIMGKKSRLKPLTADDWVINVIERYTREGAMGLPGELVNLIANTAAGGGGDVRTLSLDQRIFVANSIRSILNTIGTLAKQDFTATYPTFYRPLISAIGGNGALQWMQLTGNALGWDNAETRLQSRANARNWLLSTGHVLGKELRAFSGTAVSTPVTPHVTNMFMAAAANDRGDFDEAHERAVKAAMKFKKIDAKEAREFVKRSFSSRHPLKNLFRTTITEGEPNIHFSRISVFSASLYFAPWYDRTIPSLSR